MLILDVQVFLNTLILSTCAIKNHYILASNSNYEPQRHRDAENTQIKRYGDNRDNEDVSVFTANPMKIVSFYPP
ncbi:MAG: hypothetical protein ABH886_08925, partial [Candidatus Desantisbacteria bacterium]